MKVAIKNAARKASGAAALALVTVGHAMAQETTNPTTDLGVAAINGLKDTGTSYIAAAFGVAVLVAGGFWGISMMKKAFGAAK